MAYVTAAGYSTDTQYSLAAACLPVSRKGMPLMALNTQPPATVSSMDSAGSTRGGR
jgi:hypothetical protein